MRVDKEPAYGRNLEQDLLRRLRKGEVFMQRTSYGAGRRERLTLLSPTERLETFEAVAAFNNGFRKYALGFPDIQEEETVIVRSNGQSMPSLRYVFVNHGRRERIAVYPSPEHVSAAAKIQLLTDRQTLDSIRQEQRIRWGQKARELRARYSP